MDESTYNSRVATAFKRISKALDDTDPDLFDVVATPDMVTIVHLPSGERVIVNTQRVIKQIWVAGQGQGIHFHFHDPNWVDDKAKGLELFSWVSQCIQTLAPDLAVRI